MNTELELLTINAVHPAGPVGRTPPRTIEGARLTRRCVQSLAGPGRPCLGAVFEPSEVLGRLDGFEPSSRQSRTEFSALLKLALVAEAYGMQLCCHSGDPVRRAPIEEDPRYRADDVQSALRLIAGQLHCTVEHAARRLSTVVDTTGTPLLRASRDVVAGRLGFVGDHGSARVERETLPLTCDGPDADSSTHSGIEHHQRRGR